MTAMDVGRPRKAWVALSDSRIIEGKLTDIRLLAVGALSI
jgi:hypothetical protein